MKVLLVNLNRERVPQPVVPLGLCLVASAVEAAGFSPHLLDLHFSRRPEHDLAEAVRRRRPDAIGLSLRNLDSGDLLHPRRHLPEAAHLAHVVRALTSAPIIIGGPAVSLAPEEAVRTTGADYAVVGDGEGALPEALRRLAAGEPVTEVSGVMGREAGTVAPAREPDLDRLPLAHAARWLDLRRYLRAGTALSVQSKRGCGFSCIYCSYRRIEGTQCRLRSPSLVAEEVQAAAEHWGVRRFELVDAVFTHPPEHALALCEEIARRNLRVNLHTTGLNPASAPPELFRAMRRAGFASAVCAADSGSDTMLANLQRGFTAADVAHAAAHAHAVGISVLWNLMVGGPGECEATLRETLHFVDTALAPQDRLVITMGLRVYAGTELARIAVEQGVLPPEADLTAPAFYFSPHIPLARARAMLDASPRRAQMLHLSSLQRPWVPWALRGHAALHLPGAPWAPVALYNRLARRSSHRL